MCLTTKEYKTRRELREDAKKIAKEDIKVFKVLRYGNQSPFQHFTYEKGHHYTEKLKKEILKDWWEGGRWTIEITKGLHAFISHKKAKNSHCGKWNDTKVFTMWIPKGSIYYLGVNGDIVSDNLIWY